MAAVVMLGARLGMGLKKRSRDSSEGDQGGDGCELLSCWTGPEFSGR